MTWDERLIEHIQALELDTELINGGAYLKYQKGLPNHHVRNRYWIEGDGTIHRWARYLPAQEEGWRFVTNPRIRAAILVAVWPRWEPRHDVG